MLERSAKTLIKEIILVDDNNDDVTIGEELKIIKKVCFSSLYFKDLFRTGRPLVTRS